MKTSRTLITVIIIAGALILLKIFFFPGNKSTGGGAKGNNTAPISVTGFVVKQQHFENTVQSNGTIYAYEEAELRAEIAGKITSIRFKEGSTVTKGELLVKINDADLQANLKKLNSQLKLAQDKLERQKKLIALGGISQE
jgi:membrane fusion protein, multidrug efflux system